MKRKRVDQENNQCNSSHKTNGPFAHHLERILNDKRISPSDLDWNELPLEILLEILLYIKDPKSLLSCSLVSTTWNLLINQNDQKIWKNICLSEWQINQNNENKHFLEECETTIDDSDAELCGVDCWKEAWLKSNTKTGNMVKDTKRVIYEFIASTSTDLFLGRMKFPAVPSMLFSLSHLKELFLDGNDMKHLPWQLCYLTSLTKLDLSRNFLTCLPERLTSLVNLQHLLVSNNKFSSFPPQIFSFTQLASLNLSYNNIGTIPPQVSVLTNLVSLYLCDTKLSAIPPELSTLAKLHDLNLLSNNIGSLPPALSTLTSLRYLFLSKNRFTSIPSVPLCCWTELVTLNLDGNLLTSLPSDFSRLTNLQFLNLSDNLVSFERSQFRTLKSLYVFNGIRVQLE